MIIVPNQQLEGHQGRLLFARCLRRLQPQMPEIEDPFGSLNCVEPVQFVMVHSISAAEAYQVVRESASKSS